jgi:hypothetical protein
LVGGKILLTILLSTLKSWQALKQKNQKVKPACPDATARQGFFLFLTPKLQKITKHKKLASGFGESYYTFVELH